MTVEDRHRVRMMKRLIGHLHPAVRRLARRLDPRRRPGRCPPHLRPLFWTTVSLAVLTLGAAVAVWWDVHDSLEMTAPPPTPFLEDRFGNYLGEAGDEDAVRGFWPLPDPLPERITACLLAIEDKRFHQHGGVDLRALGRAVASNLQGRPRQGASTIAMQVARMQRPGRRTYWRKLGELVTAGLLVRRHGRTDVLRHYLCIVPMGNQIHGVAYAARRYFRKPPRDLGWAEAALLAAIPKAPGRMNLFDPQGFGEARRRAALILDLLHEQQVISTDDHAAARRHLFRLAMPVREYRPFHSFHAILRLEQLLPGMDLGIPARPIRTSLDLRLQDRLYAVARRAMPDYRARGAGNVALLVAERATGKVRGYLGSEFYNDARWSGAINYAATPRSSGSTLKPFIYALGLADAKYTPGSVLADLPLSIAHSSGDYSVTNYDESYLGPLLYRQALANSRNIPAVEVLRTVGLERTYRFLERLGLTDADHDAGWYGLGLAIGGMYVTLEDLVAAYGCLANDGRQFRLVWREETSGVTGEALLPPEIARQVTLYLADPLARLPSFSRMGRLEYPFPVALKTGTSQGYRDAWTVAWSADYIVGAWVGHPDNDRMKELSGLAAAGLVKEIMEHLHPAENRGILETPFPPPTGYRTLKICPLSGQRATPHCSQVVWEYFRPGTEPVTACTVHRPFAVDARTGRQATPATPPGQVELKTCVILPPEYAVWSARQGYGPPPVPAAGPARASIEIREPVDGSHFLLDPETPRRFQTLALKARVAPAVSEIVWIIDGRPQPAVPYPYVLRWPLQPGRHSFQARFPQAAVASPPVTITVAGY